MRFEEGTTVKTADGDKVGTVDHIVVNPSDNEVTHIVVEKGFLFTDDRVVPVEALREADDDVIILDAAVEEIEEFPQYEETYYVSPRDAYNPPSGNRHSWYGTPMFYYPPLGTGMYPSYSGYAGTATAEKMVENVPADTIMIEEGMKVTTAEGEHAGDVEEVFTNNDDELTHLLISKGFIFSTERLIPIHWVNLMTDKEVRLAVHTDVVEDLPEYSD